MDLIEKLNRYLATYAYPKEGGARSELGPQYPFITISREAGAGGHSVANAVLEELARRREDLYTGWTIFDAAFCARILEDAMIMASLESLQKEETRSPWEEAVYELVGGRAATDKVFRKTFQAMKLLAKLGKIIVIGRGGACATQGLPLGIHVRLIAPLAIRVERMMQRLHVSEANARRMIDEYDLERAKYVRFHFGQDIRDPLLYHATWNTERLSLQEMRRSLLEMVDARAPMHVSA